MKKGEVDTSVGVRDRDVSENIEILHSSENMSVIMNQWWADVVINFEGIRGI